MSLISCNVLFRKSPLGYWELLNEGGGRSDEAVECICEFRAECSDTKSDVSAISAGFKLCSVETSFGFIWVESESTTSVWDGLWFSALGEAQKMGVNEGIF